MTYHFQKSARIGEVGCQRVRRHLLETYNIWTVDTGLVDQFKGIDLNSSYATYEVKTDQTATRTSNAFIETFSNLETGRRGWALTCQAMWLLYFVTLDIENGSLYWFRPSLFVELVPSWETEFPIRDIPNVGYTTQGVCVPLRVFGKRCERIEFVSTTKSLARID